MTKNAKQAVLLRRNLLNDSLWQIIVLNALVFIGVHIAVLVGYSDESVISVMGLPAHPENPLQAIYSSLTYMYTQYGTIHLLYNMLWLWCFGSIAIKFGSESRRIGMAYLIGGFSGAGIYLLLGVAGLAHGTLIGASAAVLAVIAYSGASYGRRQIQLVVFGKIQVRWLAAIVVALTLAAGGLDNAPETGPHLAGLIAGILYAVATKRRWVANRRPEQVRRAPLRDTTPLTTEEMHELDNLLKKVSDNGYSSLSATQRGRLFVLSQRINN